MSLRQFYPWRVHPAHPFLSYEDDDYGSFPFAALIPRWRRQYDPFSDFERILAAGEMGYPRRQNSTQQQVQDPATDFQADDKNFAYKFDLSGFKPADVKVKTVGQKVVVEAESEENDSKDGCHSFCHRHYHKSLVLPKNVKPEDISSTLSEKGILLITAPLFALEAPKEEEREVLVQRESSEEKPVEDATMKED